MLRFFGAVLFTAMLTSTSALLAADATHPLNPDQQAALDALIPVDPNPNGDVIITEEDIALAASVKKATGGQTAGDINTHICFQIQCE